MENSIVIKLQKSKIIIKNYISKSFIEEHISLEDLTDEELHNMIYNICKQLFNYYQEHKDEAN